MGLFHDRTKNDTKTTVPVWFMRQAGRYHNHYQNIKKDSDFMTMCKNPELACEVTMGPIQDFDFDAAILFSDLLFPLEQLDMGLSYESGPPTLKWCLENAGDLKKLKVIKEAQEFYKFQKEALMLLKKKLPTNKSLLGFVGAPFTLYSYAVEGGHSGNLTPSKTGFFDGRFAGFMEILHPQLLENIKVQIDGGADAICLFDTASGELALNEFKKFLIPELRKVTQQIKNYKKEVKVVYYSKLTHLEYLQAIEDTNIDVLGIDWRMDITKAINTLGQNYMIQGNLDPSLLHCPWNYLEESWKNLYNKVLETKHGPQRWICGLGHGVLPKTPESNVKKSIEYIHKNFLY